METIHTLPPGVSLGDLAAVKVGDEVTTVQAHENGGLSIGSSVFLVRALEGWRVLVRRTDGKTHGGWQTKNGGGCPYAMHPAHVMRYYYSANPEHIAQAKRNAREARAAEEARKAAFAVRMEHARAVGEALGDGWHEDEHGECQSTSIARTLAEQLTPEQVDTLAGWLGVRTG